MAKFEYRRDENGVYLAADGENILRLAGEVSFLIHNLYNTLMRRDPRLAAVFRHYIVLGDQDGSPQWKINEIPSAGVEIVLLTPKKNEEGAE